MYCVINGILLITFLLVFEIKLFKRVICHHIDELRRVGVWHRYPYLDLPLSLIITQNAIWSSRKLTYNRTTIQTINITFLWVFSSAMSLLFYEALFLIVLLARLYISYGNSPSNNNWFLRNFSRPRAFMNQMCMPQSNTLSHSNSVRMQWKYSMRLL